MSWVFKVSILFMFLNINQSLLSSGAPSKPKANPNMNYPFDKRTPQYDQPSTHKPKKCRCLGRRSDGPLKDLCVIPCSCPGNCGND